MPMEVAIHELLHLAYGGISGRFEFGHRHAGQNGKCMTGLIISAFSLYPVNKQPGCPKVRMAGFGRFITVSVHDLPPIVFLTSSVWERRRCANQQ